LAIDPILRPVNPVHIPLT